MSICRARLRNISNALTFRMSGEQIRLHVPPKLFGVNSWIAQMIRQWIPDCWSGDIKCTGPKSAAANSRNWQLMTSGRSQMATRNCGDWRTVVGEIPWSSMRQTTMDCHSKLVLHQADVLRHFEHAATCPWPSSAPKTKQSEVVNTRCDKDIESLQTQCQRAMNTSQLPKPEETCLADTWNMPVNTKIRRNRQTKCVVDLCTSTDYRVVKSQVHEV